MNTLTRSVSICMPPPPPPPPTWMKKKVMAPPMTYDLRNANPDFAYQHLTALTQNDAAATEYIQTIQPTLYAQRQIVFGYIPAPPDDAITKQVIGLKGYFFKMTTACSGIYFIWHDRAANVFLFWGPSIFKVSKAMNSIRWRICKHYDMLRDNMHRDNMQQRNSYVHDEEQSRRSLAPEPEDDETDDDMPGLISMGNSPDYEQPEPC